MPSSPQSIFQKGLAVSFTVIIVLFCVLQKEHLSRRHSRKESTPLAQITNVNHVVRHDHRSASAAKCSPENHVLFLKTHKTGSSTIANILFRYGDFWNLSFVLPSVTMLGWPHRFHRFFAHQLHTETPNILCSHSRFNKKPMNRLFPKETSRYITILRNPVDNFESIFNYMELGKRIGLGNNPDSLQLFLERGGISFSTMRNLNYEWLLIRNPLLYDLGLSFKFYQNLSAVNEYIQFLDKEFDLVMIMDYFDESLVLMKRLLCWKMEDILHLKLNDRQEGEKHAVLNDDIRENVKQWNKADALLFDHFNKSFWKRIEDEGKTFNEELANFRQRAKALKQRCVTNETRLQFLYAGKYVKGYNLKHDLPDEMRVLCEKMTMTENGYLEYLRGKQKKQVGTIVKGPQNYTELSEETVKEDEESWDLASDLIYKPVYCENG